MRDILLDLVLPKTDRIVAIQWAIMAPLWVVGLWISRRWSKDLRQFVWGLVLLNAGWFMARMVH